jgi:hypothetical protein
LGWITVQHLQIANVPTDHHLFPVHNLVGHTQVIWKFQGYRTILYDRLV